MHCPLALAFIVAAAPLGAQRPLNLGFEMVAVGDSTQPWGWSLGWSAFAVGGSARFALDSVVRHEGRQSLRIVAVDTSADAPPRGMQLQVPAEFARGHSLRLRGAMRASALRGRAMMQLEAWGDRVVPAADTAFLDGGASSGDWKTFDLAIKVPTGKDLHSIVLIPSVQGSGTAWFDGMELSLDGRPLPSLPAEAPVASPAQLATLRPRLAFVRSVDAADRRDTADLAKVASIIGNARVVGLGESTHGTSEFFQVKHRILRELVEHHGFTVFAIEANQLAVERINTWVHGGPGTAKEVARAMFRVWNTEEMLALLEWLRSYNATAATPVQFVGYDMQDHVLPRDSLLAWLRTADPFLVADTERLTSAYRAQPSYATPQVDDTTRMAWSRRADTLKALIDGRRAAWLASARTGVDSAAVERAVHHATLYSQAARLNATLNSPDRDSLMAANLDWILRTQWPGRRTVVWAHDVHVSKGGDPQRSFNFGAQMGAHIAHTYGHDYRVFSLLTARGTYSGTRSFSNHQVIPARGFPAPAGSVEHMLSSVRRPAGTIGLVLDLRGIDARTEWLRVSRPLRHIGYAAYDYGFDLKASMPLEFDGVIFIEQTSASRMTR